MPYYEVSGYSDAHGDSLKNVLLSHNRAKVVADFLTAQGVDNQTIIINYFGASRATSKNSKNPNDRKVEILAFSKLIASWKELTEKPQIFMITNKRDTVLTGKKGTIIKLPANCLSGDPTKPIKMVLKEYYGQYDMLMNNMTTLADGKLLESSGMLFLAAEQNGKPLTATKPLTYQFPNQDKNGNTDYNLYKGVKTAQGVNWKLTEGKATSTNAFAVGFNREGIQQMGTGEVRAQQGLSANMSGIMVNIGGFDLSLNDCNQSVQGKGGMKMTVEIANQIYSDDHSRTAKYAVACSENAAIDAQEIGGLFFQYANKRFPTKFYMSLTSKTKLEFHLDESCHIDKAQVLSENSYMDSVLYAMIGDWQKTNYFKKAHKFKNKTLTIHLLDKELACSEAQKYYQKLERQHDSIVAVQAEIIKKDLTAIEKSSKDSIDFNASNKFIQLATKKYFNYEAPIIGFTNCDRSVPIRGGGVSLLAAALPESKVYIVFKNSKSMTTAFYKDSKFEAQNLPNNEPVYVIALTDKDGKAYMDIQETRVGSAPITMNTTLATPTKLKEMRSLLQP